MSEDVAWALRACSNLSWIETGEAVSAARPVEVHGPSTDSLLGVVSLALPGTRFEVDAIAVAP